MSKQPRSPYGAERQCDDGCVDAGLPTRKIELQSVHIGEVEVTALPDSGVLCDPRRFLTAFADELLEEFAPSLSDSALVRPPTTCFLVRTPTQLVLVDAGIGNRGATRTTDGFISTTACAKPALRRARSSSS